MGSPAPRVFTKSEAAFLERCRDGKGWFVPSQAVMVRRLAMAGLVEVTDQKRYNVLRGSHERKAEVPGG